MSDMITDPKPERRYRYECWMTNPPKPGILWEFLENDTRRMVCSFNLATLAEAEAMCESLNRFSAPQQPAEPLSVEEKYPLTVEQASGRRVCRICGMSPVEQTLDGEGDVLECAHPDCLDREQAAAAERKEPATVGMRDDAFSPADIDELKKMREESGNPNLGKSTRPPRSIPLAEPSAKSEPQLTDWDRSELGIKAMHKAYAMLGSGYEELKRQLAAANAEIERLKGALQHEHDCNEDWNNTFDKLNDEIERLKKIIETDDSITKIYALAKERDKAQADLRLWREAVRDAIRDFEHDEPPNPVLRQLSDTAKALRDGSLPNKT